MMSSSIELVDQMDHNDSDGKVMGRYENLNSGRKSTRRGVGSPNKGGGGNHDLFLEVENGDGNGPSSPNGLSATADCYDGLGLEEILNQRMKRKRVATYIVILFISLLFIGVLVHVKSASSKTETTNTANTSPDKDKNNDDTIIVTKINPDEDDDAIDTTEVNNDDSKNKKGSSKTSNPTKSPTVPKQTLWPTTAPLPTFEICKPQLISDKPKLHSGLDVFHISEIRIVPEAPTKDDYEDEWEYTFSDMDMSDDASIVAVSMSDFGSHVDWEVGLVRVFAYDCSDNTYKQLGQDLLGVNEFEQFGHHVSSSKDGKVMAISAPQENIDDDDMTGFVEVYYLDDNRWTLLGSRIDEVKNDDAYMIGHAIDLSNKGETLALMAIIDSSSGNEYVTSVYQYDIETKDWIRKGHDLTLTIDYADDYDFNPQISLNDDGDELSVSEPSIGVVTYEFNFESDKWKKQESRTKQATFVSDESADSESEEFWWVDTMDMDNAGNVVAYSAWYEDETADEGDVLKSIAKVFDYTGDDGTANELFVKTFTDFNVDLYVAVADDGNTAAIVAARADTDDENVWSGTYVGSMTIIAKKETRGGEEATASSKDDWYIVGKGTDAENLGVPGNFIRLSDDGQIAAVGSEKVIALYGINLDGSDEGNNDTTETTSSTSSESSSSTVANTTESTASSSPPLNLCVPYPDGQINSHVGDLDDLPKQENEHTLSIAMSTNGSIVAVGIDSFDGEDRGLVRIFGWDCTSQSYEQIGQDLFGEEEFDGFGQSVDLSSDGLTLVIGANQPPPGKSGYVEIYKFNNGSSKWKLLGHRLDNVKDSVYDIGREVRISDDGSIVMFSGSVENPDGWDGSTSFVRVVENKEGEWRNKGDDLISSVTYDEYGTETHISLASGSNSNDNKGGLITLGVTGSYSTFMAKIYYWDESKNNWTESIIPPLSSSGNSDESDGDDGFDDDMYEWDLYYESYFSGSDIALNDVGNYIAIAGTGIVNEEEVAVVRVLTRQDDSSSNWTLSHDPIDYTNEYLPNSVSISADGQTLAIGMNDHSSSSGGGDDTSATKVDQGALFVVTSSKAESSPSGLLPSLDNFESLGKVDGRDEYDLLGSRVRITRDGKLAAASSHKGYVSFFKIG